MTESNKKEYLDLLAQYRLASSVKQEIEAFAKGTAIVCFSFSLEINQISIIRNLQRHNSVEPLTDWMPNGEQC